MNLSHKSPEYVSEGDDFMDGMVYAIQMACEACRLQTNLFTNETGEYDAFLGGWMSGCYNCRKAIKEFADQEGIDLGYDDEDNL